MTEQQFLALHTTQTGYNINNLWYINVNYDDSIPEVPLYARTLTAAQHYIVGITVTRRAKVVDGVSSVDITEILQGINKVRFSFDGYDYALNITSRAYYTTGTNGFPYFYFRVSPFLIPGGAYNQLTDPEVDLDVLVDFSPFIEDLQFLFADYDPIYNNIQRSRKSYKIVVSDRNQNANIPTNFQAIYDGTAEYAEVLDNIYYDTGWINGRYEGTKTSADNYAGLVPSIAGRSFQGEVYNGDAEYDTFCVIGSTDRIYEELFHTGPRDLPRFTSSSLGIYIPTLLTTNTTTIAYVSGSYITGSVEVGDILMIDQEKMKVVSLQPLATPNPTFTVKRGYVGTSDVVHTADTEIWKIARTDLFRFTTSRAKSSILDNTVVYVKETNTALYTDEFGTVYNSVTCSVATS